MEKRVSDVPQQQIDEEIKGNFALKLLLPGLNG